VLEFAGCSKNPCIGDVDVFLDTPHHRIRLATVASEAKAATAKAGIEKIEMHSSNR